MSSRRHYTVESTDPVSAIRTVLELITPLASSVECDLPFSRVDRWPLEVRQAAQELANVSARRQHRRDTEQYGQTGVLDVELSGAWESFVTFAAFAYDASVWDDKSDVVVALADEGQSCVVLVDDAYAQRLRQLGLRIRPLDG